MSNNLFQPVSDVPGIATEDQEILEGQLNGIESEREAADVLVQRMLKEEAEAGRGGEQNAEEGDVDPPTVDDDAAAAAEADKVKAKQVEESESQRRRRLRRESENRTRADRDRLQQELGKLKERLRQVEAKNPDRDAYGDDQESYIGDRAGYAAQHVAVAQQVEETDQRAKELDTELSRHAEQAQSEYFSEGNRKYPDFEKTIKSDNLAFTPAMAEALMEDGMHDIAYELAKQPHEVARIAALQSPILQVKEILKAQAALEAKASDRVTTKAPPPIKPIRAAGAPQAKSPSEMNFAEYEAFRKKQMAARR